MKKSIVKIIVLLSTAISIAMGSLTYADWVSDNGRYRFVDATTGLFVVNNWLQTGNGFYFFDASGYAVVGWYLINGKYYYFDQNGLMQTGFQNIGGETYYLDTLTGAMVTGWVQTYTDGVVDYYYFDNTGARAVGWRKIDNKWYYFYDGKCIVNTFAAVNGTWYHFNESGAMDTGWIMRNGKMFFFNLSNGSLTKGWIQDEHGNEYYLSEVDGSLIINMTINIGGITCTFDSTGKCIAKNADAITNLGLSAALNQQPSTYGINVGVSPSMNQIAGSITSSTNTIIANQDLAAGSTAGPK